MLSHRGEERRREERGERREEEREVRGGERKGEEEMNRCWINGCCLFDLIILPSLLSLRLIFCLHLSVDPGSV